MAESQQAIMQLRAAAASAEGSSQATIASLLAEVAEKSSQLVDAERRFSQLEALMQRIASRTGQGQVLAAEGLFNMCSDDDGGAGFQSRSSWQAKQL